MVFSEAYLLALLQQYLLPFFRIGGLFLAMPVIGTRVVPARVRIVSAVLIAFLITPFVSIDASVPLFSLLGVFQIVQELLIGVALGFSFQLAFHVFVLAGQFMAMKMGLGFASMNDPTNGVQTTVLSQFYLILVTVMFVSVDGHLVLIEMLVHSFQTFPAGQAHLGLENIHNIASLGSWLFASALVIALPVLTSLLVINIAFGVMSRAAPQLNIFAVGFPFTLICGMVLIWIGLKTFVWNFEQIFEQGFEFGRRLLNLQ